MADTTPKKKRMSLLNRIRSTRRSKGRGDTDSIASGPSTPERAARSKLSFESHPDSSIVDLSPSLANSYDVISVPKVSAINIHPEKLWDHAYDRLRSDQFELVDLYEKLLSVRLDISHDASDYSGRNIISQDRGQRQPQMERLLQDSLNRLADHSTTQGNTLNAIDIVLSLKSAIDSELKPVPIPAVATTGLCVALQLVLDSTDGSALNQDGITIVISKLKRYSVLSAYVQPQDTKSDEQAKLRSELAESILDLYQAVLEYAIKTVCSKGHSLVLVESKGLVNLDNWIASLDQIEQFEAAVQKALEEIGEGKEISNSGTFGDLKVSTKEREFLNAFYVRDMAKEMASIQQRDPLLPESSRWALNTKEYAAYVNWHPNNNKGLLWVRGDAGKGKTMVTMGIVQDLTKQLQTHFDEPGLSYFFSRTADSEKNSSTSVLRSLIWMLLRQKGDLLRKLSAKFDEIGHESLNEPSAFDKLKEIFLAILKEKEFGRIYLVIDALNECSLGLSQLLQLVAETSINPKVKWILSSRNEESIEEGLSDVQTGLELPLESHAQHVSQAIGSYIDKKISDLNDQYKKEFEKAGKSPQEVEQLQEAFSMARNEIHRRADGTFLFAAQASKEIQGCEANEIIGRLQALSVPNPPEGKTNDSDKRPQAVFQRKNSAIAASVSKIFLVLGIILFLVEYRSVFTSVFHF
ncbi:WD40 repeat-like protein [Penicillium chermesinum]|uniref:WD40 repeat-like protein n=1 Tax=Penicillium chermesinum TaxID=63820 RepID=A0A9W9NSI8_9EURO|nr:WD40 repeat-like protein [Penicillium chermesinum]KAJ5223854.1 WD40 repeat-like protein [Penicillium chermesinum]